MNINIRGIFLILTSNEFVNFDWHNSTELILSIGNTFLIELFAFCIFAGV